MRKLVRHVGCVDAPAMPARQPARQRRRRRRLRRNRSISNRRRRPSRRPHEFAAKNGWAMAITVVGPTGDLVYFSKMDGTQYASIAISQHKARAAATFRRPTKVFEDRIATARRRAGDHARRRHRIRRRHSARDRRQDRRRDRLQRRHRRAGRPDLPGRRRCDEVIERAIFEFQTAGAKTPAVSFQAPIRLAEPLDRRRGDVAERQQHPGPDERRGEIGDLETPIRHREHAGDQRHRRAERPGKAADEDRESAPLPDEGLARRNDGSDAATTATCDRRGFRA